MMASGPALGDGSDTLRRRIRVGAVALTLAKHAPAFGMLCLIPALWALVTGAGTLALPLILWAGVMAVAWRYDLPRDLRASEAMVNIALVFLIGALGAVPAFMSLGMSPVGAVFEAMSGLTTTGLSVASDPDAWPFAAHVLRAWLQWVGGLLMATAVLAFILPSGTSTRRLGEVGIDQGDRIASTRNKARQLLLVYVGLTGVMAVVTALVVPDWREALVLTLSAISTGGFAPRSDSLTSYTPLAQGVVIVTCVMGSISLLTYVLIVRGDVKAACRIGSVRRVGLTIAALCAVAVVVLMAVPARADAGILYASLLNLISAITTAGYSVAPLPAGVLIVVLILAMLVGGDSGSTGGGLKLARASLLLRGFRHAVRAPLMPDRAVAPLRMDGDTVGEGTVIATLALVFIYMISLIALTFHFMLHDYPLADALFDSISALSTIGLSSGAVGADLPWDLKLSLTLAMWLGRLEFIAVLVLLWPRNWIKGH